MGVYKMFKPQKAEKTGATKKSNSKNIVGINSTT
jgi:hypothetical protein